MRITRFPLCVEALALSLKLLSLGSLRDIPPAVDFALQLRADSFC
ncbi:protein of unknown function [Shinella sp. WSC3-e]|nr:protein of unknown function [Shinella sp. WSC3-e]